MKWAREFFQDDVTRYSGPTMITTVSRGVLYENDIIVVSVPRGTTNITEDEARLIYRVRNVEGPRAFVFPVIPYEPVFPTKRELNKIASIKGAKAQQEKHQRVPKKALVARTSYQQMCRIPCYRGTRPR